MAPSSWRSVLRIGFSVVLGLSGVIEPATRPVSSSFEASDYYMNYYIEKAQGSRHRAGRRAGCSPPSTIRRARRRPAYQTATFRVDAAQSMVPGIPTNLPLEPHPLNRPLPAPRVRRRLRLSSEMTLCVGLAGRQSWRDGGLASKLSIS